MRLELGAGHRPTIGYTHNDLYPFDHIEHVGPPWLLALPDDSVTEVLALAFIEHLTYEQALDTFRNVHRMLTPEGTFLFDVPDYPTWVAYYLKQLNAGKIPYTNIPDMTHIRRTLFGWQRWPGDEHKYGWDEEHLADALTITGFRIESWNVIPFQRRTFRQRFHNPTDAHLYITATK